MTNLVGAGDPGTAGEADARPRFSTTLRFCWPDGEPHSGEVLSVQAADFRLTRDDASSGWRFSTAATAETGGRPVDEDALWQSVATVLGRAHDGCALKVELSQSTRYVFPPSRLPIFVQI